MSVLDVQMRAAGDVPREPSPAKSSGKTVVFDDNLEKIEDVERDASYVRTKEVPDYSPVRILDRRRGLWVAFKRNMSTRAVGKKRAWYARAIFAVLVAMILLGLAFIVWTSLLVTLIHRLKPFMPRNGLVTVLNNWREPTTNTEIQQSWLPNFSSGVTPKPIHSHNDYTRDIPLFRALSVGCMGVEADIHLHNDELLVAHSDRDLKPARTLNSLYLNPLWNILQSQNSKTARAVAPSPLIGVWNEKPQETLILMLDFKTSPNDTLPLVMTQLQRFRDAGYLTRFNGTDLVQGPITIVGSGDMCTRLDLHPSTDGYIFLDAPLDLLSSPAGSAYNSSNSLYASAPLGAAAGHVSFGGLDGRQKSKVREFVREAQARGLTSRFWDTPGWPVGLRDGVWKSLVEAGAGMLNVDDVRTAAMWNWDWCRVGGMSLC